MTARRHHALSSWDYRERYEHPRQSDTPIPCGMAGVMTALAGGPTLGLAEAAKACGVSVSTLRRKRPDLEANGAVQTDKGWRIPVTALIALGLMSRTTDTPHETHHETPATPVMKPQSDALTEELDALRSKLAAAEQRAAVAEAVAAERERTIQSQAMALRMLEAGASKPPVATPGPPTMAPAAAEEGYQARTKKSFWERLRG